MRLYRYDLHVLLVNHGKRCPRCAKNGKPRKASDGDCPLFGSKSITEVLQEDAHGLQVKQEADDHLLVKAEEAEEWCPAESQSTAKQEPDAVHHHVMKHDADSKDYATEAVKTEAGLTSEGGQPKQDDGNDVDPSGIHERRSSRSKRARAKAKSDV